MKDYYRVITKVTKGRDNRFQLRFIFNYVTFFFGGLPRQFDASLHTQAILKFN